MFQLLAFISIWYGLKSAFVCLLQDRPNALKIGGNITSVLNGILLILSPIIITIFGNDNLQTILNLNIAYNIVDFINASTTYQLHHIGVFICDYLIWTQPLQIVRDWCMIIYTLIEISNVFIWINYHKIQAYDYKPSASDIRLQLCWFGGFRIIASLLMVILCWQFNLLIEFIIFGLMSIGTIFWGFGMYKKLGKCL